MAPMPETADHQLFRVELCGDTLIISPRGDAAGFTVQSVATERAAVDEITRRETVKHLIIDLGAANYFGSIVLGTLIQFGTFVQQRRGRIALAAASDDMQEVLRLMKLDRMWEFFPTRAAAKRAIAKIPLMERLLSLRGPAAAIFAVAAVILLIIYFPRVDYGRRYYVEVSQLWREAEAKRSLAGDEEWERFVQRSQNKLEPILQHLLRRSANGQGTAVELNLIYVIRDYWASALNRRNPQAELYQSMLQTNLKSAEEALEHRPAPRKVESRKKSGKRKK